MLKRAPALSRRDIFASWWRWLFFAHANYNEEGYQATGFAHALAPVLRRLYCDPQAMRAALLRHLVLFSTDPEIGGLIHGMTIALEERRAAGDSSVDDAAIQALKTNLMGPLGAVGDTIKQALWLPVWLALGIGIALAAAGTPLASTGPLVFSVASVLYTLLVGWLAYYEGYRHGPSLVAWLLQSSLPDDIRLGGAVLGTSVFAALGAQVINLPVSVTWVALVAQTPALQPLPERLLPPLLALLALLALIWLLRQGISAAGVALIIFGLSFGLALLAAIARIAVQSGPFGLFASTGLPALLGSGLLVAGAYVVGRRERQTAFALRCIVAFLVLAVLVDLI